MAKELSACKTCAHPSTIKEHPDLKGMFDIEVDDDGSMIAVCVNCSAERPYHGWSPNPENGTTKSQQKKIDKIRSFGEDWSYHKHGGYKIEFEHLDWGPMSLVMKINPDSYPHKASYHVIISRRGKAKVMSAGGTTYPDSHANHFANMIGGHDETDT